MLGVKFECNSSNFYLSDGVRTIGEDDVVVPPCIVQVMGIGGISLGNLKIKESVKEPGQCVLVSAESRKQPEKSIYRMREFKYANIRLFPGLVANCTSVRTISI